MALGWEQDPDLENRDVNGINQHIKLQFEEILGEPDGIKSIDCVWKLSYKCFNLWKNLCYIIMTTLCGIFVAMYWGCEFAALAFQHIWQITPFFKLCEIQCGIYQRCYGLCVHCMLDPVCESIGHCFDAFRKS